MGIAGSVADSPLVGYLQSEFERVAHTASEKSNTKNRLYLHQVQQLQPPEDCPLDLGHIATLWKLDADHDGCVTFEELLDFAEFTNERRSIVGSLDFQGKLKAQCVMDLWEVICDEQGEMAFADWVVLLVSQNDPFQEFNASPGVKFMSVDAVMTLYKLLQPYQVSLQIDQQGFLDLLQQIGENQNLMSLQAEELDDWVPVEVVQRWVKRFINAYANLFRELGLEPSRPPSTRE